MSTDDNDYEAKQRKLSSPVLKKHNHRTLKQTRPKDEITYYWRLPPSGVKPHRGEVYCHGCCKVLHERDFGPQDFVYCKGCQQDGLRASPADALDKMEL